MYYIYRTRRQKLFKSIAPWHFKYMSVDPLISCRYPMSKD